MKTEIYQNEIITIVNPSNGSGCVSLSYGVTYERALELLDDAKREILDTMDLHAWRCYVVFDTDEEDDIQIELAPIYARTYTDAVAEAKRVYGHFDKNKLDGIQIGGIIEDD